MFGELCLMYVNATTERVDHWHRSSLQGCHSRIWSRDDGAPALDVEFPRVIDNIVDSSGCHEQDRPLNFRGMPRQTSHVLFPSPVPPFILDTRSRRLLFHLTWVRWPSA